MRTALFLIAMAGVAHAQPPPPGLYIEASSGAQKIRSHTGARVSTVPTKFTVARIFSIDNNNQKYRIHLETAKWSGAGRGARPWLSFGGKLFFGSGSSTHTNSWYVFDVDRKVARAFSKAYGSPLRTRKNLAKHIAYRFRTAKKQHRVGDEFRIFIDIWRRGARKVAVIIGGANRGPRNDNFRFEVFFQTKKLPLKQASNFGGRASARELGSRRNPVSTSAKLSGWVWITKPGRYTVRCFYTNSLVEPGSFTGSYKGDEYWLFKAKGTVIVNVVP